MKTTSCLQGIAIERLLEVTGGESSGEVPSPAPQDKRNPPPVKSKVCIRVFVPNGRGSFRGRLDCVGIDLLSPSRRRDI